LNESRKFTHSYRHWKCALLFYADRIENIWDLGGFGKEVRKKIIMRNTLGPYLGERSTGLFSQSFTSLRYAGAYLVGGAFSYVFLTSPWRYVAYLFFVACAVVSYEAIKFRRKALWIEILTKGGAVAVSVQVTDWTKDERKEFKRYYEEWITTPDWAE
jgi:hypothetical protein